METMLPPAIIHFISEYGSFALFFLLAFGIIGIPVPDESLLLFSGYLMAQGALSPWLTPVVILCGSMVGITISYSIGAFGGRPLILHYGKWLYITQEKLDNASHWFDKVGKWILIFGYFLPGVRHLAGLTVGIVKMPYSEFAVFAYTGAFLWSTTFVAIGYFFL